MFHAVHCGIGVYLFLFQWTLTIINCQTTSHKALSASIINDASILVLQMATFCARFLHK